MRTFGNIIWHFPFFGFVSATFTYLLGLLLTVTVVAAPIGLGLMELGKLLFWPFGKAMVKQSNLNVAQNPYWKTYSTVVMVLYLPLGLVLAFIGVLQIIGSFIFIISIPVGMVVAKSLSTFLNPVGKKCVSSAVVAELERQEAQRELARYQQPGGSSHVSSDGGASTTSPGGIKLPANLPAKPLAIGAAVLVGIFVVPKILFSLPGLLFGGSSQGPLVTPPATPVPALVKASPVVSSPAPVPASTLPPPAVAPKAPEPAAAEASSPAPNPKLVAITPAEPVPPAKATPPEPAKLISSESFKIEAPAPEIRPAAKVAAAPKKLAQVSTNPEMAKDKAKLREGNAKLDDLLKN